MIKSKKIINLRKYLVVLFSGITISVAIIGTACSTAVSVTQTTFSNQIPSNTVYETIHNLEYSLLIINSDLNSNGTAVLGTSWLFDYQLNDASDNITCYFATNLHVADGLHNPLDFNHQDDKSNLRTQEFYLGKYDVDPNSQLSSIALNKNITYYKVGENAQAQGINNLPKTQFIAVDPSTTTYIDFAVLAMTFNKNDLIYKNWILNSINQLNKLVEHPTLGSSYVDILFPSQNFLFKNNFGKQIIETNLKDCRAYIAGYPYYDTNVKSRFYNDYPIVNGGGLWTINEPLNEARQPIDNKFQGQTFDTNKSSENPPYEFIQIAPGVYNPWGLSNWRIKYHGTEYAQSGLGYIVNNSNISGGSSGSVLMNQNFQIMGIYYGSWQYETSDKVRHDVPYGLCQILRHNVGSPIGAYDLIAGDTNSYKQSLENTKTWLFSV